MRIKSFLANPWVIGTSSLLGIILCAIADWETGPEIAFSILYLIPVSIVTWRSGRAWGLGTAVASGATWLFVELMTNAAYSNPLIPYWNGFVRLTIFCLVSFLISEIGKRKLAEAALDLQRRNLQSILDSMGEGIIVADTAGKLLLINPAAEAMLGLRRPQAGSWQELFERELQSRLTVPAPGEDPLSRALKGEAVAEGELQLRQPDSEETRCLQISGRPWLAAAGKNIGHMAVLTDITARRQLERQIGEVSDREQRRLGQDLHDGLCQHLVSLSFVARMLADKLAQRYLPEAEDATRVSEMLSDAISQAKDIARGLYHVQLEVGGLAVALEDLASQTRARQRIECEFRDRTSVPITETLAMNDLFRIAQEAVNNAVKHAQATRVSIMLESNEEEIILKVEDNGRGTPPEPGRERGLGLHIMEYRARMIGGEFRIQFQPGQGTVATCTLARTPREFSHAQSH